MRRQKSDNIISWKTALSHDKSSNYLSIHTSNKVDVPKVVKAIPDFVCHQPLPSPTEAKIKQGNSRIVEKRKCNIF